MNATDVGNDAGTGPRCEFLGTGASGGTPGEGRSRRRESSLLVTAGDSRVLLDASRDLDDQLDPARTPGPLDAVVLTHGHRDASGGVPALRRRRDPRDGPVPVYASPETHTVLAGRYARLDHVEPVEVEAGRRVRLDGLVAEPVDVPHGDRARFRTYAWRLEQAGRALVYAPDVARPAGELRRLATGADLLVVDGATWGRRIFSHLRIDEDLPAVCDWEVDRILLTQIGRSVPPHAELAGLVRELCGRAEPAHDGLVVTC